MNRGIQLSSIFLFATVHVWGAVYSQGVNGQSSVTIPNTTHHIGSKYFSVSVFDGGNQLLGTSWYSYTINGTTYDVTLQFPSPVIGTIELRGPYPNATSASTDFQVTMANASDGTLRKLVTCSVCTESAYARRNYSGKNWVATSAQGYTHSYGSTQIRVYLLDNRLIYGLSVSSSNWANGSCAGDRCRVDFNVSGFPTGSVPLAYAEASSSGLLNPYSLVDYRPWR